MKMIRNESSNESCFIGEDESIVIHFFFISESYYTYTFLLFFFYFASICCEDGFIEKLNYKRFYCEIQTTTRPTTEFTAIGIKANCKFLVMHRPTCPMRLVRIRIIYSFCLVLYAIPVKIKVLLNLLVLLAITY